MNATMSPEVRDYLAAVSEALGDLPAEERDDLISEVAVSLLEAGGPVAARLGPPEEFAAELRAAAGLQAGHVPARHPSRIAAWLRAVAQHPRAVAARPVLRRLAPIWWAVRGYVAVAAIALLVDAAWSSAYPGVPRLGSAELGLLAIAAGMAASILLGLRGPGRQLALIANLALAVAAIPVAAHLAERPPQEIVVAYVPAAVQEPEELTYDMAPVRNIYPFTRDGRLLHDVVLYDGRGLPLEIGRNEPDVYRRYVLNRAGQRLYNTFPIRYFEAGTARVAHPDAIPPVRFPRIATPPLKRKR
jgi:hypothetical protein